MASQRTRNASELAMAVHSDTVRAPEARLEDLLGIMSLTKAINCLKRYASAAPMHLLEDYAALQHRQV
jgi:hypothetical protein